MIKTKILSNVALCVKAVLQEHWADCHGSTRCPTGPGANPLTCETSQGTRRGPSLLGLCLLRAFSELRSLSWLKGGVENVCK